ncbi:MAG TPA: IPT/TIG domain-containing protein [Puia sp.]|jgi:hypothetical protein|nr:IPT/TIG domain-containing protein [Puia sp.]
MQSPIKLLAFFIAVTLFVISCSKKSAGSGGGGGGTTTLHIDSISPTSGGAGVLVTIYGAGFSSSTSADAVTVNGVSVAATDAASQTISFNVPVGLVSGPVAVTVGGKSATGPSFTYTPSAVVSLYAGGAGQGYGDGGLLVGQFDYIKGMAIDGSDNVYVADGTRIRKVTPDGTITTLAGTTTPTYMDGPALTAEFLDPQSMAVSSDGTRVYVGDEGSIRLIYGGNVSTLSGTDVNTGVVYMDGSATTTRFNVNIPGIFLDNSNDNIYVADAANGRVRTVSAPSGSSSTLSGNGNFGGAPAYGNILSIAGDGKGSLFVAQEGGSTSTWSLPAGTGNPITGILRVTESGGQITTLTGSTTANDVSGDTASAEFLTIGGLYMDAVNKILYMGYNARGIREINLTNGQVTTVFPAVDTRSANASLITSITVVLLVKDSQGNIIFSDGTWIYKVTFGQ